MFSSKGSVEFSFILIIYGKKITMFQIYMKLIKSLIKFKKNQQRSKSEHPFVEKQSSYFVTKF